VSLVWLALSWVAWCVLHSLLIHPPVEERLARLLGRYRHAYRLTYNLVALATLLPVGLVYLYSDASPVLIWPVWMWPVKLICWLMVAALTWEGYRVYDTGSFLGLAQLEKGEDQQVDRGLPGTTQLVTSRILRYTRHPWYLAGFLLLWCRDLDARGLATNLVLSVYLLVGILLEERKLVRQFGNEYRQYQKEVPMLWGLRRKGNP